MKLYLHLGEPKAPDKVASANDLALLGAWQACVCTCPSVDNPPMYRLHSW